MTAASSNPSEEEEQLSLDPPEEGEDDDEEHEEATAAEILQAAIAQGQLDKEMVSIDQHEVDETEEQLIQRFVQDSCKCDLGSNRSPCCTTITVEHFRSVRCQMADDGCMLVPMQNYQGTTAFLEAGVEVGFARRVRVGGTFGMGDVRWMVVR